MQTITKHIVQFTNADDYRLTGDPDGSHWQDMHTLDTRPQAEAFREAFLMNNLYAENRIRIIETSNIITDNPDDYIQYFLISLRRRPGGEYYFGDQISYITSDTNELTQLLRTNPNSLVVEFRNPPDETKNRYLVDPTAEDSARAAKSFFAEYSAYVDMDWNQSVATFFARQDAVLDTIAEDDFLDHYSRKAEHLQN